MLRQFVMRKTPVVLVRLRSLLLQRIAGKCEARCKTELATTGVPAGLPCHGERSIKVHNSWMILPLVICHAKDQIHALLCSSGCMTNSGRPNSCTYYASCVKNINLSCTGCVPTWLVLVLLISCTTSTNEREQHGGSCALSQETLRMQNVCNRVRDPERGLKSSIFLQAPSRVVFCPGSWKEGQQAWRDILRRCT